MEQIEDDFGPLESLVTADEVQGLAHVENALSLCLLAYPDPAQKLAALGRLKELAGRWSENSLSRFLERRIDDKRQRLMLQLAADRAVPFGRGGLR